VISPDKIVCFFLQLGGNNPNQCSECHILLCTYIYTISGPRQLVAATEYPRKRHKPFSCFREPFNYCTAIGTFHTLTEASFIVALVRYLNVSRYKVKPVSSARHTGRSVGVPKGKVKSTKYFILPVRGITGQQLLDSLYTRGFPSAGCTTGRIAPGTLPTLPTRRLVKGVKYLYSQLMILQAKKYRKSVSCVVSGWCKCVCLATVPFSFSPRSLERASRRSERS